jgi:hypothetical protein
VRGDRTVSFLSFRRNFAVPVWRCRDRFSGKAPVTNLGRHIELSLADARRTAEEPRPSFALGYDVAKGKKSASGKLFQD